MDKSNQVVITRIKELVSTGVLKPGDKLPSERKLAEDFKVGRTQVREALHKLEFYGIIKTLPQSGSVINGIDINTLDGLISDVLSLQDYDFFSLVETRLVLEINAIRLCAERWNEDDLKKLQLAHDNFIKHYGGPDRDSHDFAFHRAIAEASHNPVFKAMLMIITPDIMSVYQRDRICGSDTNVLDEHSNILAAIKSRNGEAAAAILAQHLQGVVDFAKSKIEN